MEIQKSSGKAPGSNGIPPEVIKCGKPALLEPLHEQLCLCWEEGAVPPRHARRNHRHLGQEQGWPQWLQQLQGHFTAEHRRESFFPHSAHTTTDTGSPHLSWVPVWLQGRKIYHWHDLHCPPDPGEMLGTGEATLPRLHWLNQSVRSRQ